MIDAKFKDVFGAAPKATLFTPGRVNLIGEHTDYNGGMVLPTAIELGLTIALSPRSDDKTRLYSDKFDTMAERTVSDAVQDHWSDYVIGAVKLANETGLLDGGADIAIETTLPFGAGLSSSAAVIVCILKIGRELSGKDMSDTEISVLARRVENEFIGMPCGIMDQMAVAIARPGQALALDTESLNYDLVDLPKDHHMAVVHSGQFRELAEGRYKIRKEECDEIKVALGHDNICRVSDAELAALNALPDILQRRAKHCVTDHRRTIKAVNCLRSNDMVSLGKLMNESHISMRDDFEITVPTVDKLVADAVTLGALGARQTGGGFGGCIVACIPKDKVEGWSAALFAQNPDAFWVA